MSCMLCFYLVSLIVPSFLSHRMALFHFCYFWFCCTFLCNVSVCCACVVKVNGNVYEMQALMWLAGNPYFGSLCVPSTHTLSFLCRVLTVLLQFINTLGVFQWNESRTDIYYVVQVVIPVIWDPCLIKPLLYAPIYVFTLFLSCIKRSPSF